MKLRVAPATRRLLTNLSGDVPHALLLSGATGVGLATLASHIAENEGRLLAHIRPESKSTALASISVERIRELYVETKSRLEGLNFVIIDDADTMNTSAQNALLKLLEEPNQSIRFILTSHSPDMLLPTIRSRTQQFTVPVIDLLESKRLLKELKVVDALDEQRLLFVAQGLPAELARLSSKESDFKLLTERVQAARQLVEGSSYQRLALAMSYSGDRQQAVRFIDTVILLLRRTLSSKPDTDTLRMIERMTDASQAIRANGNIKLQLSAAVLQ
ncbi:MAG: AAA family ATPase [Patescibacteria group bacterium]